MRQPDDWVADSWVAGIRDRPGQNVWQFAAENISFDGKAGNITGPWRPDLTPFTLLFQEAITNDFTIVPDEDWWLRELLEREFSGQAPVA